MTSFTVTRPGLQTTVQGRPRTGLRHLGVPASGAADPLSLALANRLVGNDDLLSPGLETALDGVALRFTASGFVAITGASAAIELNGERQQPHRTIAVRAGDDIVVGAAEAGARSYLAFAGGLEAETVLGSASTYLPAALGGYRGRALARGDSLSCAAAAAAPPMASTPNEFRPPLRRSSALRACRGAELAALVERERANLFEFNFTVGRRADRMGLCLEGIRFRVDSGGRLPSAAVFPGTVQCPEDGRPIMLSIDAQTTGGYPRIAQVARCDRHQVGQLRPGDRLRLLLRDPDAAAADLKAKHAYWERWLPGAAGII